MSREIEADFRFDWENEATQCQNCSSFDGTFCSEAQTEVPADAHCDFFQSRD